MVKNPYLQCRRSGLDPWVGKIPWRRKWLPTPEFLPGRSHEQRKTSIPSSTNNSTTQRKCLLRLASIFCLCEVFYIRLWANNCLKSLEPASLSPLIHRAAAAAAAKSLQSCPTLWPHRRQPTRLRRPWDSPGKNTGVGCHLLLQCMKAKSECEVAQSCPTLHDPMDWSLPGSSVRGIFQARVLEWVLIAFYIHGANGTNYK